MFELDLQKKGGQRGYLIQYILDVYCFKGGIISESFSILKQKYQSKKLSENKPPLITLSFSRV